MNGIVIPKKLAQRGDLVVISRQEYEALLKSRRRIRVVEPTREELRAIRRGERELAAGEYVEWSALRRKLSAPSRRRAVKEARTEAWFWTPEWQKKEKEADEAIRRGEISGPFTNARNLIAHLRKEGVRARKTKRA